MTARHRLPASGQGGRPLLERSAARRELAVRAPTVILLTCHDCPCAGYPSNILIRRP